METFYLVSKDDKIISITPYSPFADGMVEKINALPIEEQLGLINNMLVVHNVIGQLIVESINADENMVLYSLTLEHVNNPVRQ